MLARSRSRWRLSAFRGPAGVEFAIETDAAYRVYYITHVTVPLHAMFAHSHYVKVRDRTSYDYALASAAAVPDVQRGIIQAARLALGGVATKPWRCHESEQLLVGRPANKESYAAAAKAAVVAAKPSSHNAFKVELAQRVIVRALESAGTVT